jgi:uncharacterized membrane protein
MPAKRVKEVEDIQSSADRLVMISLIIGYSLAVLLCLSLRPLWIDEVVQLTSTTLSSTSEMLHVIPINPGATPLAYLTQRPFVLFAGPSAFWARLPSAIFSVASVFILIKVCRKWKFPSSLMITAVAGYMLLPSQFRYAAEARPYAEALFFAVTTLLTFTLFLNSPGWGSAIGYIASLTASLYTQPLSAFPALAMSAYAARVSLKDRLGPNLLRHLACMVVPVIAFLPWYVFASKAWRTGIVRGDFHFNWTSSIVLDAIKGVSGGSFVCSACLIALACVGASSAVLRIPLVGRLSGMSIRALLICSAGCALLGVLASDAAFGYFFAGRQFVFAAPVISILAAAGLWTVWMRSKIVAAVAALVFIGASLASTISYETHYKENWKSAAEALSATAQQGYCIEIAGDQNIAIYAVFEPALKADVCEPASSLRKVALVSNLYTNPADLQSASRKLAAEGFETRRTISTGGTTVALAEYARE